jgi:hypothetical protein
VQFAVQAIQAGHGNGTPRLQEAQLAGEIELAAAPKTILRVICEIAAFDWRLCIDDG